MKSKKALSFGTWRNHSNSLDWMCNKLHGDAEKQDLIERACFLAYECGRRHEKKTTPNLTPNHQ